MALAWYQFLVIVTLQIAIGVVLYSLYPKHPQGLEDVDGKHLQLRSLTHMTIPAPSSPLPLRVSSSNDPALIISQPEISTESHSGGLAQFVGSHPLSSAKQQRLNELEVISMQKYNITHPFQQEQGPEIFLYPPTLRSSPLVISDSMLNNVQNVLNTYAKDYARTAAKKHSCKICIEHNYVASHLWENYFKKLYHPLALSQGHFDGHYFEMGALDGISGSMSIFFDQYLHWDGLLVEANPPNFASLLKNRPHAWRAESAVCTCNNTRLSHPSDDHHADNLHTPCQLEFVGDFGGTGGSVDSMDKLQRKFFHGTRKDTYHVSCVSLMDILQEAKMTKFDFFSLDVEGAEYATLQTVDWSRVQIWLLLVELNHKVPTTTLVRELLTRQGFVLEGKLGEINELWRNPSYKRFYNNFMVCSRKLILQERMKERIVACIHLIQLYYQVDVMEFLWPQTPQ